MGLACLCHKGSNSKTERHGEIKLGENVPGAGVTGMPIFSSKWSG